MTADWRDARGALQGVLGRREPAEVTIRRVRGLSLPKAWIGGRVLGSALDFPDHLSLVIETPDGTVVRVAGQVEVVNAADADA